MAILNDIPMDVLLYIVQLANPITSEFDDDFDNPDGNPFLPPPRVSPRADCVNYALVCQALYHATMPVLWEYIVVDSTKILQALVKQILRGFHHLHFEPCPRRLDLRLPAHYSISKVSTVVEYMNGLTVLVVANAGSSDGSSLVRSTFLKSLIRFTPHLRRLQFMNIHESLTLPQFEAIGRSLRNLRTLQCFEVIPRHASRAGSLYLGMFPKLEILSLGRSAGPPNGIMAKLFRRLTRCGTLTRIRRLDLLFHPSALDSILATIGPNLQHVTLYCDHSDPLPLRSLLTLCPHLVSLTLVLAGWNYSTRWPKRIETIRHINIVQPAPPFHGAIAIVPALRSMARVDLSRVQTVFLHFDWDFYYDNDEAVLQRCVGSFPLTFGHIEWME